jgi:hypothetical protein
MTMLNRSAPDASPNLALTDVEIALLDQLVKDKGQKSLRTEATLSLPDQDRSARRLLGARQ